MMNIYKNMTNLLHDEKCGEYAIEHFIVPDNSVRAMIDGILPGEYVRLMHSGELLMSDTSMEKRTNAEFCINAYGDVLIGGLGMGMIVLAIQDKEEVKSITILEKAPEIISMICGQLKFNDKVKVIETDVFTWKPNKGQKFDCIYMDIWTYINSNVYQEEMKPLKRKYGHYLKPKEVSPKRINECWAEWYAKDDRRLI